MKDSPFLNFSNYTVKTSVLLTTALLCTLPVQAQAQIEIDTDSNSSINLDSMASGSDNSAVVNEGVTVDVTNGHAVFGQNLTWSLDNQGTLKSSDTNSYAVQLQNGNSFHNEGTVTGAGGGFTAINAGTTVINSGVIETTGGIGVELRTNGILQNKEGGRITGESKGIYLLNGSADGAVNSGLIEATNGMAVHIDGGLGGFLNDVNGVVRGTTDGVYLTNGTKAVINNGLIEGTTGNGISFNSGGTLYNLTGSEIKGGTYGVYTTNGSSEITTYGTIEGGDYSVYFNTGNGILTLQTGALLIGTAYGGNTSQLILNGTGSASNDFLVFGSLDMVGSEWTLLGRTEAKQTTVSNGRLIVGAPGSSGAVLSTDTVNILAGTEMVGFDSTVEGAVTNNGTLYVGSGYTFDGNSSTGQLDIVGSYTNAGQTILSSGSPFGNTLNITGNYNGSGGSITLGALLDDGHLGAITSQQADRMLVRGDATGTTSVNVVTISESQVAAASQLSTVNDLPAGSYVRADGEIVSPNDGVSIIQVSGTAQENSFTLSTPYVTGGTPFQFKLYAYGPDSSNGSASADQNLVGNPNSYWDYRLSHAYVTAVPLPPGEVVLPGDGGGDGGSGSGGDDGDEDEDIRWKVVPQVPDYISIPGALFSAGVQDLDNLHRRLGEIRTLKDDHRSDSDGEVFARIYGSNMDYSTNVRFRDFGFDAKQNYRALQFGSSKILRTDDEATIRLGGAVTLGHSKLTPDAVDGQSTTKTDTQSFALIGTYLDKDGWYVDTILSFGFLRGKTRTETYGNLDVATIKGNSYSASIEAGYPFALGDSGFNLEPQIQYIWQNLHFKDFTDFDQVDVNMGHQSQSLLRTGLRLSHPFETEDGNEVTPYARVDYRHGLNRGKSVTISDTDFEMGRFGREIQVGAGISGAMSEQLSLYGEFSWQDNLGDAGWKGWQFSGGLRYTFGK
ncbi:autotransporter family protein [Zophobihabitans entericus]|uniref:Autotransporter outer membrane beta-barrel domain-containing protein n=1 Tax=Zophobihabitans entericus TaxID=1635327 RepID=A0A6G9IDL1_9GAMM|nr:autotransporter outer membrane beta-barrel domain-containing protein [Zophobihabitans entericus]QIQ21670.1 autotransporter outer membrane beta-barrel domain-containing protein [Zophobihabitans entericus]